MATKTRKPDVKNDRARQAVKEFRKLQPTLTAYARNLTGKRDVRVEMSATDNGSTDGTKIYFKPPIRLGDMTTMRHERGVCDKRDPETLELYCKACEMREGILAIIYHEIAHIAYDSFAAVTSTDAKSALRMVEHTAPKWYHDRLVKKFVEDGEILKGKKTFTQLAQVINPYFRLMVNALEDVRINERMADARPGTRVMQDAKMLKIAREGVEQKDENGQTVWVRWNEYPTNHQIILAALCVASGYDVRDDWFEERVVEAIQDTDVAKMLEKVHRLSGAQAVFEHSFEIFMRLRELGFFILTDEEPPPAEPEPEPEEENDEESESGSSGDAGDATADTGTGGGGEDEEASRGADGGSAPDHGGDEQDRSDSERSSGDDDADSSGASSGAGGGGSSAGDSSDGSSGGAGDEGSKGESASESGRGDDEPGTEGSNPEDSDGLEQGPGSESDGPDDDREGQSEAADDRLDSEDGAGGPEMDESEQSQQRDGGGSELDSESDEDGDGSDDEGLEGSRDSLDGSRDDDSNGSDEGEDNRGRGDEVQDSGRTESGADEEAGDQQPLDYKPEAESAVDLTDRELAPPVPPTIGSDEPLELIDLGLHPEIDESGDATESMDKALEGAIVQSIYFEMPSQNIIGLNVWKYDDRETDAADRPYHAWEGSRYSARSRAWMGTETQPVGEDILGPALMRMRVVFADNQRSRRNRNQRAGRIDPRTLGKRAWSGDDRLFGRKVLPNKKDYFVVIMLDVSGSTMGVNIKMIKEAGLAQAELCHRMGIKFAIYAHTGAPKDRDNYFDLWVDQYEVKAPEQAWDNKAREALINLNPSAANLDGHSMEFARKLCDAQTETNKVILYYSDGAMPLENHDEELDILRREIATCKAKGYTLLGVGVRTDSPSRHGLDTVQIDDSAEVGKVVSHLERVLVS
jgi:uncharacterized membrane protein YgcG